MIRFAFIACDNGFGHIRRCMLVAKGLIARGHAATLFAPAGAVARLATRSGFETSGLEVVDFATRTTIASVRGGDSSWLTRLPSLERFDVVVSDNLPEILTVRPDAILSGSFLWHLVDENLAPALRAAADELLARHRPMMIAAELFCMPDLAAATRLHRVGLCVAIPPPDTTGTDLLVACGGTSGIEDSFRAVIEQIAAGPQPAFRRVHAEPRLVPRSSPSWIVPATFDDGMYRSLAAAVCRPGVGTMTDCAWAGARVFAAYEPGNREIAHNASRFAELGIGEQATEPGEAFAAACRFVTDPVRRAANTRAMRALDFDGVRETGDVLLRSAARV